jgi:hypothetical protein
VIKYCKFEENAFEKYRAVYRVEDLPVKAVAFIATLIVTISTADLITCCSNMFPAHRLLSSMDC